MKHIFLSILLLFPIYLAAQELSWGDQGDGTYRNPVLCADFSDPDVIRVDGRYYMVARRRLEGTLCIA